MIQINSLLLLVLGELLLVTAVISVVMVVTLLLRKQKDRSAALALIGRIKEDEKRRQDETNKIMVNHFGLEGEELKTVVQKIGREEKLFYQTMVNLYLKRDLGVLRNLNVQFEGAVEPYRSLKLVKAETSDATSEMDTESAAEIERLKTENECLSEELRITMDTMGRMLTEYSSMFAGGSGEDLDKGKMAEMLKDDKSTESGGDDEEDATPDTNGTGEEAVIGSDGVEEANLTDDNAQGEIADALPDELEEIAGLDEAMMLEEVSESGEEINAVVDLDQALQETVMLSPSDKGDEPVDPDSVKDDEIEDIFDSLTVEQKVEDPSVDKS